MNTGYSIFKQGVFLTTVGCFTEALGAYKTYFATDIIRSDGMIVATTKPRAPNVVYHNTMVHVKNYFRCTRSVSLIAYVESNGLLLADFLRGVYATCLCQDARVRGLTSALATLIGDDLSAVEPCPEIYQSLFRRRASPIEWVVQAANIQVGSASKRRSKLRKRVRRSCVLSSRL